MRARRERLRGLALGAALLVTLPLDAQDMAQRSELLVVATTDAKPVWLPAKSGPYRAPPALPGLRVLAPAPLGGGAPVLATSGRSYRTLGLVASAPGHLDVDLGSLLLSIDAVEARAFDERGQPIDPQGSHASLSRTLPAELGGMPGPDHDAFELLLIGPAGAPLDAVTVLSRSATAEPLDVIPKLNLLPGACPSGVAPELVCRRSPPIRSVPDALDRAHPATQARTLRAQLGGSLSVSVGARALLELRVGGPRQTRFGPIARLQARLRVFVLRQSAGGMPAVGGSDAGSKQVVARELATAGALWGQCGVELAGASSIQVVDAPMARLVAVGCGFGQPASGGELALRSGRDVVRLTTLPGEAPTSVALRLAAAWAKLGRRAQVFENQRRPAETQATADVLLGGPALEVAVDPLSTDPTLPLCLGQVDLSDGLTHFGDGDAFAGTLEERALLRAFDDGDPSTIEVLVVPSFTRSERIGESFIASPGSSLSSAVIIDRWAIRAGARSFAFAHELGHVLLAMPGHPDDFGVDKSWSLMDADVADATIFGPRRLSVADCERMLRESGPDSPRPLLQQIPL